MPPGGVNGITARGNDGQVACTCACAIDGIGIVAGQCRAVGSSCLVSIVSDICLSARQRSKSSAVRLESAEQSDNTVGAGGNGWRPRHENIATCTYTDGSALFCIQRDSGRRRIGSRDILGQREISRQRFNQDSPGSEDTAVGTDRADSQAAAGIAEAQGAESGSAGTPGDGSDIIACIIECKSTGTIQRKFVGRDGCCLCDCSGGIQGDIVVGGSQGTRD